MIMCPEEITLTAELEAAYALIRKLHHDLARTDPLRLVRLTQQEQITLKAAFEAGER
jgi:hypothetical protein